MASTSLKVLIVGTGVSALLLAHALLSRNVCSTLTLVGSHRPIRRYRLSYWSDSPSPFDDHYMTCQSVQDGSHGHPPFGHTVETTAPPSGELAIARCPPCLCMMRRTIARPRPTPPVLRFRSA